MPIQHQQTVKFDPSNKEHRAAVGIFLKRRAWGDVPFRFANDPKYGSIADQVEAKLLQWYVDKEFKVSEQGARSTGFMTNCQFILGRDELVPPLSEAGFLG